MAKALNLDITSTTNFWKQEVSTELNVAVLHSYVKAGVTIVDHHSQAEQFMEHFRLESQTRGGCPADWVWIVPPQCGSLTPVYHQEMLNYHLSPSYDSQADMVAACEFLSQDVPKSFKAKARDFFFRCS